MSSVKNILVTLVLAISLLSLSACRDQQDTNRETMEKSQSEVMKRALEVEPTYIPENFLVRKQINKYMKRLDRPRATYYVYILANSGDFIGYFVVENKPASSCDALTNSQSIEGNSSAKVVVNSPTLNGVFSNGTSCQGKFFFDAESDALLETMGRGLNMLLSDAPLSIDAPHIKALDKKH